MNIKKDDTGILLYQTDNCASIQIFFDFLLPKEEDKKMVLVERILEKYLLRTNKKYPEYKTITDKMKSFYSMDIKLKRKKIGNNIFLQYTINLLDPKIIEEDYFEDALLFANDILYAPNFIENRLDKGIFEQIKKELINDEKNIIANPKMMSERLFYKSIAPDSIISKNVFTDFDEFESIINDIKEIDIINFYKKLTNELFCKGYILGNVTDKVFETICKIFPLKSNNQNLKFDKKIDIENTEVLIENKNIKHSNLIVVYDIPDYDINKFPLYQTLDYILGLRNGLCFKILRDELGLVYNAYPMISYFHGFLCINADITAENKEKCLKGIDEIINQLQNPEIVKERLEYAKEKQISIDYMCDEDSYLMIEDLENYVYKIKPSRMEIQKQINALEVEDIIKFAKALKKKFIYFYKGGSNEK